MQHRKSSPKRPHFGVGSDGDKRNKDQRFLHAVHLLFSTVFGLVLCMVSAASAEQEARAVTWDDLASNAVAGEDTLEMDLGLAGEPDEAVLGTYDPFGPLANEPIAPLKPTDIANDLLGAEVAIDGYVLPLARRGNRVVEFLLVPWVGACIHAPIPSPDQIIHVSYPGGIELRRDFAAIRLSGKLGFQPTAHELFLVDGRRVIPTSYTLKGAEPVGSPSRVSASSVNDLPLFTRLQIRINTLFTGTMAAIADEGSPKALLLAIFVSFGYGVLHTLGPGHGKAVVVSYFVGTGGTLARGLAMGARIAVLHVLSALVIVFLFDFIVRHSSGTAPSDYRAIRLASYALIMAIGAAMLREAFFAWRAQRTGTQGHGHEHMGRDHSGCAACAANHAPKGSGWVATSIGVVPCTGALIVMLFGLANNLIWPAIFMVVAISVGMAVAMSAIGMLAIYGRNLAEHRLSGHAARHRSFEISTRIVGAIGVLAIGTTLFTVTVMDHFVAETTLDRVVTRDRGSADP